MTDPFSVASETLRGPSLCRTGKGSSWPDTGWAVLEKEWLWDTGVESLCQCVHQRGVEPDPRLRVGLAES